MDIMDTMDMDPHMDMDMHTVMAMDTNMIVAGCHLMDTTSTIPMGTAGIIVFVHRIGDRITINMVPLRIPITTTTTAIAITIDNVVLPTATTADTLHHHRVGRRRTTINTNTMADSLIVAAAPTIEGTVAREVVVGRNPVRHEEGAVCLGMERE